MKLKKLNWPPIHRYLYAFYDKCRGLFIILIVGDHEPPPVLKPSEREVELTACMESLIEEDKDLPGKEV